MTVTEIRKILESPYDRKVWKSFLQTQFTNNKLNAEDRTILLSDKTLSKQCLSLGNYEISDYSKIGIFEVELNEKVNIARNRVALRNLIKEITPQLAGVMVVFVQGDKWRFSYISKRKVKNTNTNEIEDKQTAPKQYTYLFGKNEKALTAAIRFNKLIEKQKANLFDLLSLNDFEEAFSVEKLSKEFFQNYKATYEDFVQFLTGKRYGKKGNKYVEQVIHEPNWQLTTLFNKDEKQARDFCKRMMGRIVFLYFIQKKGWLAVAQGKNWGEGNPDYLFHLFKNSKSKEDFYQEELTNLFFKTLNNHDSENPSNEFRFPYLNGGLFDDSHDKKYNRLQLPEKDFENLFKKFDEFNFTVYEDAPDEHTVAVDPEMLGHIFENLLEDNKDKGAFYTPKEIVHYMCKESLKAYLYAHHELHIVENELAKTTIEKIIQQQELGNDEKQFAEKNAYKIIDALEQLKICDPAIGSGAFPMGLLQEIFNAQIYLQELKGFKKGVTDAAIKKHIIEESIYGVDIDAGAVDIARLRFWLSLVVDEVVPQPLPNLDFKIVCANTLIPLGKLENTLLIDDKTVKELAQVRHDYFVASHAEKKDLEKKFKRLQDDLLKNKEFGDKEQQEVLLKLYNFNPFDDHSNTWFDPWWMFGIKDGFDIVIGNPPYGAKISAEEVFIHKSNYKSQTSETAILFIEKGYELLKVNGVETYIIPKAFTYASNYERIRNSVLHDLIFLVDCGKAFDKVKLEACVFGLNKNANTKVYSSLKLNDSNAILPVSLINKELNHKFGFLLNGLNSFEINLANKILTQSILLSSITKNSRGEILQNKIESKGLYSLIGGKEIDKFGIRSVKGFINDQSLITEKSKIHSNSILAQNIVAHITQPYEHLKIIACIPREVEFLIVDTINQITIIDNNYSKEFIWCLLNSKLINWYSYLFILAKAIRTIHFDNAFTSRIPIPKVSKNQQQKFIALVSKIDSSRKENSDTKILENTIDMLIYQLYDLTQEEIDLIEGKTNHSHFTLNN